MSFPEEPLDLSILEGGGYYPATIRQKLKGDKYEIVRKLGYGPRSSTWLVLDVNQDEYFAVKIFTVAASEQAKHQELPMLRAVTNIRFSQGLPVSCSSFWEKSSQGDHLCIVLEPLSTSVQDLLQKSEKQRFPVHIVKVIVYAVVQALESLHGAGIMHGAIKAENILLGSATQTEDLKAFLDSEPAPTTLKVKKYTTVQSQPLVHNYKWNDKRSTAGEWWIYLCNFGHAQRSGDKPEKNVDYLSAPETLLQDALCSLQTDIWMLGVMTFYLLTGCSPFFAKGNPSKQIATMCAILEDEIPEEWLGDKKMKDYKADAHGYVTSIETSLADSLPEADVAPASAFIKACLRLNPKKRLSVGEVFVHKWLRAAGACSCGFYMCGDD